MKRLILRCAAGVLAAAGATALYINAVAADVSGASTERIEITATKFAFEPKEIRVKKGTRVTLLLKSPDFVHGLSIPDFNVRADGIPGKIVEITFVADKAGKFIYLCDNFCGEDHDRMAAWLVVTES